MQESVADRPPGGAPPVPWLVHRAAAMEATASGASEGVVARVHPRSPWPSRRARL